MQDLEGVPADPNTMVEERHPASLPWNPGVRRSLPHSVLQMDAGYDLQLLPAEGCTLVADILVQMVAEMKTVTGVKTAIGMKTATGILG